MDLAIHIDKELNRIYKEEPNKFKLICALYDKIEQCKDVDSMDFQRNMIIISNILRVGWVDGLEQFVSLSIQYSLLLLYNLKKEVC